MSITQQFTVYTGTFVNQSGFQRQMRFIKVSDFPSSVTSRFKSTRNLQQGYETVFDVDLGKYRTFNYNTMVGQLSSTTRSVTISV
jgi:hypothetical protein